MIDPLHQPQPTPSEPCRKLKREGSPPNTRLSKSKIAGRLGTAMATPRGNAAIGCTNSRPPPGPYPLVPQDPKRPPTGPRPDLLCSSRTLLHCCFKIPFTPYKTTTAPPLVCVSKGDIWLNTTTAAAAVASTLDLVRIANLVLGLQLRHDTPTWINLQIRNELVARSG